MKAALSVHCDHAARSVAGGILARTAGAERSTGSSKARSRLGRHHVALPAHGPDQVPGRRVLELAAQVVHVDVHDVGGLRRLHVPDRIQQFHPRDALAAVEHQVLEQGEFLVGEHDRLARAAGRMVQTVQFQVAGAQLQPRLALAPQQGPAAGPQFMQAEGLDHQIVGAPVQAAHARVHLLARGQHQHRQVGVQRRELFKHLLAVLDRHVQIENGQVGHVLAKCLHRGCLRRKTRRTRCPSASRPRLRNSPSALSSSAINNLMAAFLVGSVLHLATPACSQIIPAPSGRLSAR